MVIVTGESDQEAILVGVVSLNMHNIIPVPT